MASFVFNRGKGFNYGSGSGDNDWVSGTYKAILIGTRWTPDPDVDYVSDLVAYEVPGANRPTVSNKVVTVIDGSDKMEHTADPIVVSGVNGSDILGAVIYKEVSGSDSLSPATVWSELSSPYDPAGATVTIVFPGGRVFVGE